MTKKECLFFSSAERASFYNDIAFVDYEVAFTYLKC